MSLCGLLRPADRILVGALTPASLIGHLYVLEGSQLGGQVLLPRFAAALNLPEEQFRYYPRNEQLDEMWTAFKAKVDALTLTSHEDTALIMAAQAAFDGVAALAEASFPFEPADLCHRITAINPEAGHHAMPQDEREMARALRCADDAWNRFPYMQARFGERGRRYTLSDGCWLVDLYDKDEPFVVRNLLWLRTVLVNRGLPTLLLEYHLDVIEQDIQRDDAERAVRATGFRAVIDQFQAERTRQLPQATHDALVATWQDQFARCPDRKVDGAAEILIAAWLDQASGYPAVWKNVSAWLTDPENFSPVWITCVKNLQDDLESADARRDLPHRSR